MRNHLFRLWIAAGAAAGLLSVAMGAYAAHAPVDPSAKAMLHSGFEMQLWHALALVATGIWVRTGGGALAHWAGAAFLLGLLGFCSGVYSLALFDLRLPMVAPTGGTLLMLGWALLGLSALRARA
jgi:uncharacterized membrane protein YgdD (TMEM256/DUF423 family)